MTIGVVIPTYNRADLLPQTLAAISAQTLRPTEVVVVDDGSTDHTAEVLACHAAILPLRTLRIANGGDLVARNAGLAEANSELIAFCDSDDLWKPDHLERMTALWTDCPDMTAAFADFQTIRDGVWQPLTKFAQAPTQFWDGLEPLPAGGGLFHASLVERILEFQPFFPSAMVVHRDRFISCGGWDAALGRTIGGDFATALRMCALPPLGVLRSPTVGIRKHRENRSGDVQAMELGDSVVLEHVLRTQPTFSRYAIPIAASVRKRRISALHVAFSRLDFSAVTDIYELIAGHSGSRSVVLKAAIAGMPEPLRSAIARSLLWLGSAKAPFTSSTG